MMEGHELSRRRLGRSVLAAASASTLATAFAAPARAGDVHSRVTAILPDLVSMLEQGMPQWRVPGLAVGVVVGEDVLLARGFGSRQAGAPEAVDADTVFQIGSATKAFAATTAAMLIDQGKLDWMDRVVDHDPTFRMFDPWVTQEFRIIDLFAQRSGLHPHVLDPLWILGYSPDDLVAALRYVPPVSSFRAVYGYQNITHQVAARIVANLVGVPRWQDALAKLVLQPLAMSSTSTSAEALLAAPNHATGHVIYADKLTSVPPIPAFPYATGPAGGINSSVNDMTKWLRLQIGRGTFSGTRLLGAQALETTWKPRVDLDPKSGFPFPWQGYASGWVVRQTAGGVVIWHDGGTVSFKSHVGFIPALGTGLVVLTNEGDNGLANAASYWFYDRLLGNPPVDYGADMLALARQAIEEEVATARRPTTSTAAGPAGDYTGTYHSDVADVAEVGNGDNGELSLSFNLPRTQFGLRPWNGDVFALAAPANSRLAQFFAAGPPILVQFQRSAQGRVNQMRISGEIEFTRTAQG